MAKELMLAQDLRAQHQAILGSVSSLYWTFFVMRPDKSFGDDLLELVELLVRHFNVEYKLMLSLGYPDAEPHLLEHRTALINGMCAIRSFEADDAEERRSALSQFFDSILRHHGATDVAFNDFVVSRTGAAML